MSPDLDTVVIGAGVVGLAAARALARAGHEVMVVEQHPQIGSEISSRNSEVIHAGIYYPPGSLRARLCVAGKALLYAFVAEHAVPHERIGKLLVASTAEQVPKLEAIAKQALASGVGDLTNLSAADIRALEPEILGVAGLHSPSTGIIDSHGYMLALQADLEQHGGQVSLGTKVDRIGHTAEGHYVFEISGPEATRLTCRRVVIAAGLHASRLAEALPFGARYRPPTTRFGRGRYYTLIGRSPFKRLIYPMPDGAWLGIHVTLDLAHRAKFGPDLVWIPEIDYAFDDSAAADFYAAIRRYWPGLPEGALQPGYTGIRPKIYDKGEPPADFRIDGGAQHGLNGLVMLFGIESPGLTASLAIAETVRDRLQE